MKSYERMDGMDVFAVYDTMTKAVEYARKKGPVLLESLTYRYEGHGMSDKMYASRVEEMENYKARDPISLLKDKLCELYPDVGPTLTDIETRVDAQVAETERFSEQSPDPTYEDLVRHVYV
jgi:pyruvate dehydrogenase E1 component alpha subunit